MPTPSRIKPDAATYEALKLMTPDELKEYIKTQSREVSQTLFEVESLVIQVRETRQLIAIAEKMLDEQTVRVPTPTVTSSTASNPLLSVNVGGIKIPDEQPALANPSLAPVTVSMASATPLATTHPSVNPGGRPNGSVFSSQDWLKIMESAEGARDVALYHDRSETGLSRIRSRALSGDFPESKYKASLFGLLLDGYSPSEVATMLHRDEDWVQNAANYLAAIITRKNNKLSVPDLGIVLPE